MRKEHEKRIKPLKNKALSNTKLFPIFEVFSS